MWKTQMEHNVNIYYKEPSIQKNAIQQTLEIMDASQHLQRSINPLPYRAPLAAPRELYKVGECRNGISNGIG